MLRKILICLPIGIIIIFLVLKFAIPLSFFFSDRTRYFIDLDAYKEDLEIVVEKVSSLKEVSNYSDGYVIRENNQSWRLDGIEISMTEKEKFAFTRIISACDVPLTRITVYPDRVTFCTEGNWYALAYMFNDRKPKFMSVPDEHWEIGVKKIEKHWYHIYNK